MAKAIQESKGKYVINNTAQIIPIFSVLTWLPDGTVAKGNAATISTSSFAGINLGAIDPQSYGFAVKTGNVKNAIAGLGAVAGQYVYMDIISGQLTLTPPISPPNGVYKIGKAEPTDNSSSLITDIFLEFEVIIEPEL